MKWVADFTEPVCSSLYAQKPATVTYCEPTEFGNASHIIFLRSILMLTFHFRAGLLSSLFHPIDVSNAHLVAPLCLVRPVFFCLVILRMSVDKSPTNYETLCCVSPVTWYLSSLTPLSISFSKILNLRVRLTLRRETNFIVSPYSSVYLYLLVIR